MEGGKYSEKRGENMQRTDLAMESITFSGHSEGIKLAEYDSFGIKVVSAEITSDSAAKKTGKEKGRYITLEVPHIAGEAMDIDNAAAAVSRELSALLGGASNVLVIGLGNTDITPDALGPKTADRVLATRHIRADFWQRIGISPLSPVSSLAPGVLGQTGIESAEVIAAVCDKIKPDAVIAVDALAAADISHLGNTVQLSDAGISPGSGVGNRRSALNRKNLGTPVIALGVPTVADSSVFGGDGGFIVTPREIDMLILRASELLGDAINFSLQPNIDRDFLRHLV